MIEARFDGIDDWNRPVFKDEDNRYYCLVDKLFNYSRLPIQKEIDGEVVYDKDCFDGEPGFPVDNVKLIMY